MAEEIKPPAGFTLDAPQKNSADNVTPPTGFTLDAPPRQEAPPQMSVAERFGTGLKDPIEGGAQLLSHLVPSPVSDAINVANNWLARHTGLVAELPPGGMDQEVHDREKAIEAGSPKGFDWWRLAGNLASPANYVGAARGAEAVGALGSAGRAALQGAGVGALQPVSHPDSYWLEKGVQSGVGAVGGALVDRATAGVAALARWLTSAKSPEALADKATTEVIKRIGQSGATAQDMLDLLAKAPGKPLTLADVGGENLQGLVGRIYRQPGEARDIIGEALRERDLNAGLRLAGDINQGIAAGSVHDTAQALAASRRAAASPKYEAAFSRIVVTPDEAARVARFINDPIGQRALQRGMRVIQLENLAEDVPFNPKDYGVVKTDMGKFALEGGVPNLRLLDAVKRGYDEIVEDFRDKTTGKLALNQYSRAVNQVRAAYTGELRAMYPRYAGALDAWGGPSRSIDALKAGEDFMRHGPDEIAERLHGLTPNDREFYKLGAAAKLRDLVAKTGAAGDEARRIVGNAYVRAQLRPLFENDEAYTRFIDAVKAETTMFQTRGNIVGGTQTAARLAEDAGPDIGGLAHAAHGVVGAAHGNPMAAFSFARAVDRLRPKGNPAVNAEIARQTTDPAEAARVLGVMGSTPAVPPAPTEQTVTPWLVPGAALGIQPPARR